MLRRMGHLHEKPMALNPSKLLQLDRLNRENRLNGIRPYKFLRQNIPTKEKICVDLELL